MKVIGISGLSRCGKDLFTTVAQSILENDYNIKTDRHALAFELKKDLDDLISLKTGIDVFTNDTKEKNIIRPLLVSYGDMMRKISEGKYWTNKVNDRIKESDVDVFFVTDIRYHFYPEDEVTWLKKKLLGNLIHVTRYKMDSAPSKRYVTTSKPLKIYDNPPNDHEMLNNPKLKKSADYSFEWEDMSDRYNSVDELVNSDYIREKVIESLKYIKVL